MTELIKKLYGLLVFNTPLVVYNCLAFVVLLAVVCRWLRFGWHWVRMLEAALGRIARQRVLAVMLVGTVSFLLSAAISLLVLMPEPRVHDEFGYLLAADTFAHGRLANPPHPLWVHFESLYTIYQPTYASMYPPGLGLFLAAGQVLTGHPIVGAWLSTALACAAICWMLMAWMPPRWALVGGLIAALHPKVLLWGQGFWGGQVALLGGALLAGAFRRLVDGPRVRDVVLMALGMAVLANSRPYEGFVLTVMLGGVLVVWMFSRNGPGFGGSLKRIVLPMGIVLALAAGWMGYYNWRVTGQALRLPHLHYEAQYAVVPRFLWLKPKAEPHYNHAELHKLIVEDEMKDYVRQRSSVAGMATGAVEKLFVLAWGPFRLWVLLIPLAALPWALKSDRWVRFVVVIGVLFVLAMLPVISIQSHYPAPVWGLGLVIVLQCLRYLQLWRWGARSTGRSVVRAILLLCVASLVPSVAHVYRVNSDPCALQRARMIAAFKQDGGRHLVIVRSKPNDWVYNDADIDGSPVVWARDMGEVANRELLDYYRQRRVWLLAADANTEIPRLIPYGQEDASATAATKNLAGAGQS